MIFKCKNCGGNAVYSPEKHKMFCPFCDSENSEERKDYTESNIKVCPECGGEVPVEEHTSATRCPYCDNYIIFNKRVEQEYLPKMIIPFQLGKETCKEKIREKFKKNIFAPTDFLSEVCLNGMLGIYVPYWFYNYDTNCDFQGEGTRVRTWTTGDTQYTETSFYNVRRNMDIDFRKIPIDASLQMPDAVMDLMEPYEYGQLEDFDPKYMSGFYAEKYNMSSNALEERAKNKMKEDAAQMLKQSYGGYQNVRTLHQDIRVKKSESNYGLLPVWKYTYHYKNQEYPFYVNGQTGKIVGKAPLSKEKVMVYSATLFASLFAILSCLNVILSSL